MRATADTDLLIIGAGPYGLSLASYAERRGIACHVVGRPMDSWLRQMPEGMFLKSEGFASNLADPDGAHSLKRFCAESQRDYRDCGSPIPIETFTDYGRWFQRALVPDVEEADVETVTRTRHGFEAHLGTGATMRVRRVAVASGHLFFRHVPPELRGLPPGMVSHSSEHRDFGRFAGKDVVVIGAGQSALESAALLREQGALPQVVVRKPFLKWNGVPEGSRRPLARRLRHPIAALGAGWDSWLYSELPITFPALPRAKRVRIVKEAFGPSGAWWLKDRVEEHVPIHAGRTLLAATAEDGKIRLSFRSEGRHTELLADHVLAATGYQVDVEQLGFLAPELRQEVRTFGGAPVLSAHFESSVPEMYFVGLAAAQTFGPVMRFVYGTRFASNRLSKHLARTALSGTRIRRRAPSAAALATAGAQASDGVRLETRGAIDEASDRSRQR